MNNSNADVNADALIETKTNHADQAANKTDDSNGLTDFEKLGLIQNTPDEFAFLRPKSTDNGDYELTKPLSKRRIALKNPMYDKAIVGIAGPYTATYSPKFAIKITACLSNCEIDSFIENAEFCMYSVKTDMYSGFYVGKPLSSEEEARRKAEIIKNQEKHYKEKLEEDKAYQKQERKRFLQQQIKLNRISRLKKASKECEKKEHKVLNNAGEKDDKDDKDVLATAGEAQDSQQQNQGPKPNAKKVSLFNQPYIPGQLFAVISVLRDPYKALSYEERENEWVIFVWGAFNSESEATAYLSDTLQHEFPYYNSFIVPMNKILYLDETRNSDMEAKKIFRYDIQQIIYDKFVNDQSYIEELKQIPISEDGKIIRDDVKETEETKNIKNIAETEEIIE